MGLLSTEKKKTTTAAPPPKVDALSDPLGKDSISGSVAPVQAKGLGHQISSWFGKKTGIKTKALLQDQQEEQQKKAEEGAKLETSRKLALREQAGTRLDAMSLEQVMEVYQAPLYAFAKREFSTENLNFMRDIESGMGNKYLYETYIASGDLNVSGKDRKTLDELAAKAPPDYSGMDFDGCVRAVKANIGDTYSRARLDGNFLDAVAGTLKVGKLV